MKTNYLLLLLFALLLSCKQQTDSSDAAPPQKESVSQYRQELDQALANPAIDAYYKEIFRQQRLVVAEEAKMLSVTEKLFTRDATQDLFYFVVFTKSMNGADGLYAEALGLSAFEFITGKTQLFARYFDTAANLDETDLRNWAHYVYNEIQISREGEEQQAVNELETLLLRNVKDAGNGQQNVIKGFIAEIKTLQP